MPGQPLLGKRLQERIGVELLDVVHTGLLPDALEEHQRTRHGRYAGGIAHALHARLMIGILVTAVVVNVISVLAPCFHATDAAAKAADADCILLGPQIRFQKNKIAEQVPGVPVDAIDMRMYGRMDGKGALEFARKLMND